MVKRYKNYGDPRLPDGLYVHESDYDALLAAAKKVRCDECGDNGEIPDGEEWVSCPDCTDLRKLLEGER